MRRATALAALALVAACHASPELPATVTARMATPRGPAAWFVWAGVRPPPGPTPPDVYLLAGEVRRGDPGTLVPLRPGVPRLGTTRVWLVLRAETLEWGPAVMPRLLAQAARWRAGGVRLAGVQVDFDAATPHLDRYGRFLAGLRRQLPRDLRLSVTGLLDGAANGRPGDLARIAGVVDEIVVQTYQGRCAIPGADRYLARLGQMPLPFRIAVVERSQWVQPPGLAANPRWRGMAVFLLPPGPSPTCAADRNPSPIRP